MSTKLDSILMIDDDNAHQFLHKRLIDYRSLCDDVNLVYSAKDGLDYLSAAAKGERAIPDLIFLDINMPATNAWDFMANYQMLPAQVLEHSILAILTTSMNPQDRKRSQSYEHIKGFYEKPLTTLILSDIIKNHFPDLQMELVDHK